MSIRQKSRNFNGKPRAKPPPSGLLSFLTKLLSALRLEVLNRTIWWRSRLGKLFGRTALLFNIDLHIGVVPEIQEELRELGVALVRFSISKHNHVADWPFPIPDPVKFVNARTWRKLSPDRVALFRRKYSSMLRNTDGFVVTLPTAFVSLFSGLGKPILGVVATRFDSPFEADPDRYRWFIKEVKASVNRGELTLVANNLGDAALIEYFLGLKIPVVPSLCDRGAKWKGASDRRVIISRSTQATEFVESVTSFEDISVLGRPYSYADLMDCLEVLVIPQNISTMTLFELATSGMPVVVPGPNLMKQFRRRFPNVLGELTFAEIKGLSIPEFDGTPMDWRWPGYLDWWLDRADFYNRDLMPNVRVANSIDDLKLSPQAIRERQRMVSPLIDARNKSIRDQRIKFLSDWLRGNQRFPVRSRP